MSRLSFHLPRLARPTFTAMEAPRDRSSQIRTVGISKNDDIHTIKYFIFDRKTNSSSLDEVLLDKMQLPRPQWIINAVGEIVDSQITASFKEELETTLSSLAKFDDHRIWILLNGTASPLANVVGEVAQEQNTKTHNVTTIGVSSLREQQQAYALKNNADNISLAQSDGDGCINNKVDYLLFADDGTISPTECKTSRLTLTFKVMAALSRDTEDMIHCITVLYGGSALEYVCLKQAAMLDFPVLVVKKSGGFADQFDDIFKDPYDVKILTGLDLKHKHDALFTIRQCMKKRHLFTFCDTEEEYLRGNILSTCLKTIIHSELLLGQFLLPLVTSCSRDNDFQLIRSMLMEGIIRDEAKIVNIILNDFAEHLEHILTEDLTLDVYMNSWSCMPVEIKNQEEDYRKYEATVEDFVVLCIPNKCRSKTARRSVRPIEKQIKKLFLCTILSNKLHTAKEFWDKGQDPIVSALIGCYLLHAIARNLTGTEKIAACEHSKYFLEQAIGIVERSYRVTPQDTKDLLRRRRKTNKWNVEFLDLCLQDPVAKITTTLAFRTLNQEKWIGHRHLEDAPSTLSWRNMCRPRSPRFKFVNNMIANTIFLCTFAYHLTSAMTEEFNAIDCALCVWAFTFFIEECIEVYCVQTAPDKRHSWLFLALRNHLYSVWNILDVIWLLTFTLGQVLHAVPHPVPLEISRLLLAFSFQTFCWRMLQAFSANRYMGPILLMILHMLIDLLPYLVILGVSVVSFTITEVSLLFPNSTWTWDFVYNLPMKGFWHIFGEYGFDEIEGKNCSTTTQPCPRTTGRYAVPIFMAVYILMTNVLLLNVIIAQFSARFTHLQEKSDQIWAWQSYALTQEFEDKSLIPPPFILVWRCFQFVRWSVARILSKCRTETAGAPLVELQTPDSPVSNA